jgi:hypothetical protein
MRNIIFRNISTMQDPGRSFPNVKKFLGFSIIPLINAHTVYLFNLSIYNTFLQNSINIYYNLLVFYYKNKF